MFQTRNQKICLKYLKKYSMALPGFQTHMTPEYLDLVGRCAEKMETTNNLRSFLTMPKTTYAHGRVLKLCLRGGG